MTIEIAKESARIDSDTIVEIAEQRLRQSRYFFLKGLRCRFASGVLTLRGRVPYVQLRESAEAIVWGIDGVERVVNEVNVVNPALKPSAVPRVRNAG